MPSVLFLLQELVMRVYIVVIDYNESEEYRIHYVSLDREKANKARDEIAARRKFVKVEVLDLPLDTLVAEW